MKTQPTRLRPAAGIAAGIVLSLFLLTGTPAGADLGPENVLLLVNSESATSRYVARMYRAYYPAIEDRQVLELTGLPDCSGPGCTAASEIITRDTYNTCIAQPVRDHLLTNDLLSQIMVIVTTAGMPYRIEDTTWPDVIYPAGSDYALVAQHAGYVTAASVESELTCLWISDYGTRPAGLSNRIVNPYQGYRASSITLFERSHPGEKVFTWNYPVTSPSAIPPKMEGQMPVQWPMVYGTINRQFGPGDIYLVCRLDGYKMQGQSAVFAVRRMLERSRLASSPSSGVNPAAGTIVMDDCPMLSLDKNRVYNLDGQVLYNVFEHDLPQPPDVTTVSTIDDYTDTFDTLTNHNPIDHGGLSAGWFDTAWGLTVLLDRRPGLRTCQGDLQPWRNLMFLCTYGKNGDEGGPADYLFSGPDQGPLFDVANGAVFTSIESYNAATLFSNIQTSPAAQGKIVDFIRIGGTGAIGFAFEPLSSAAISNSFVTCNLFADGDHDGRADLTFAEAAFSGIAFLSWAEVVIGDPLMRLRYGPAEPVAWEQVTGDVNNDGYVNIRDYVHLRNLNMTFGSPALYDYIPEKRLKYEDLCDINQDGFNDIRDMVALRNILYAGSN